MIPRSTIGLESTASQNFTFEGPQWLGLSSIQLKNLNILQNFVANNGRLLSLQSTKITVGSVFARDPSEGTYSISSDSSWISGNHFMLRKGRWEKRRTWDGSVILTIFCKYPKCTRKKALPNVIRWKSNIKECYIQLQKNKMLATVS